MSLQPTDLQAIPPETVELGQKLLEEDNPYRLIGDRLADLMQDEDFKALYSLIGGPALSPVLLALVLVFQMLEKLPDRLAAQAVRLRIDWKYALHLPLDYPGFHFTNLSHFRQRLLEHQAQYLVFDRLLQKLVALGLVRPRGKQRTDSTHVLGLIANLSRLELIWESLRLALRALQQQDEGWVKRFIPEAFLEKYLPHRSDYNLSDAQVATELGQAGADGWWLLQHLALDLAKWTELPEVVTLQRVWEQQFEGTKQGDYLGPRPKLKAHGLIQSPHEPEARYRQKRGQPWKGYQAQVSETAEAQGDPNFITDIGATDAQTDDKEALPEIQKRLAGRDLTPSQQIVDQNYLSGTQLAQSAQQGIELVGPIGPQPGPEGFRLEDFQVNLAQQQATCPAGQRSVKVTCCQRPDGSHDYQFFFGQQCATCACRTQCTQAKHGRTLTYHEHHPYVVKRWAEMETESFHQTMKRRPPIEGTISQLVRQGLRRARYRGLLKVNLQVIFTAAAVNLKRLCRFLASGRKPSWAT